MMRTGIAVVLLATTVAAQSKFEVVSIRVVPPNAPPIMRDVHFSAVRPGGQYVDDRTLLPWLIAFAYDVKNSDRQLRGLPDWAKNQVYSVSAKAGPEAASLSPSENREQVRQMVRAMLADRFQLRIHTETRQEDVFVLEPGKGGLKVKPVDPPQPPARENPIGFALGDSGGRMIADKTTMKSLAGSLALHMKRPVVVGEGLDGYYDFDIRWKSDSPDAADSLGAGGIGLLVSTLQDRLGLQLRKTKGPVEYWIVDHVAPPPEN